jgi:hypothetical protein
MAYTQYIYLLKQNLPSGLVIKTEEEGRDSHYPNNCRSSGNAWGNR